MAVKNKTSYQSGDTGEGGAVIGEILGSNPYFIVFLTERHGLRWELDDDLIPNHFSRCILRFDDLQSMILGSVPRKKIRDGLKNSLGRALFAAVSSSDGDAAMKAFDAAEQRIESEIDTHARVYYVFSAVLASIVILAGFLIALGFGWFDSFRSYLLGALGGSLGATVSVLLRGSEIEIPRYSTPREHVFQGLSRVFLGFLSGGAIVILIKAELILGIARNNAPSICAFGLVAGFSERYLPSILQKVEKSGDSDSHTDSQEPSRVSS